MQNCGMATPFVTWAESLSTKFEFEFELSFFKVNEFEFEFKNQKQKKLMNPDCTASQ